MAPVLFFLGLIGFSAGGVVAGNVNQFIQRYRLTELIFTTATPLCYWILGSLAAAIQASIGCVVAGSLFAIAQSIAMGGTVRITTLVSAVGSAVITVLDGAAIAVLVVIALSGGVVAVPALLLCLL